MVIETKGEEKPRVRMPRQPDDLVFLPRGTKLHNSFPRPKDQVRKYQVAWRTTEDAASFYISHRPPVTRRGCWRLVPCIEHFEGFQGFENLEGLEKKPYAQHSFSYIYVRAFVV